MKITNKREVEAFQKAIDECKGKVWLVAPDGRRYDLKSDIERYLGIASLISDNGEEMELFTSDYNDEMIMMNLYGELTA
jgi:hypothetical protein